MEPRRTRQRGPRIVDAVWEEALRWAAAKGISVSLYTEQALAEKMERDRRAAERAQARRSA